MTILHTKEFDRRYRWTDALAPGGRRAFLSLATIAIVLLFLGPIVILVVTSLRPGWAVFYVYRGTDFTLQNYRDVLATEAVMHAFVNSFLVATLATIVSIGVTVSSGYMLSRFRGPIPRAWFGTIYVFRTVPYISWVLPLYLVCYYLGIYDTYAGILLPHIAVHICFFSWIMKGFFDGIDPSMEYAALIDGCTRWGAFLRVALPSAIPAIAALGILSWLYTWNEFLFALILTGHNTALITVTMAQFVTELGTAWNLMSAMAVMAMGPAIIITMFAQKYVIRGLRI
ncbi:MULTISPECIES: carbohydrate ABC transporter permease [unclassified Bradyrhizobium]|uniref:carbohydrate ABC transporter permease n=1 Tax=unclassified Bradyrhizobium TaxID=2631580 RepID=UPI00247A5A72|nr:MULTISPECIES: carbohydrate ABC transporter permease [unclassified Bradyrhizobium]WGS22975.1 carbohydrate ABC transporter permease [Bradyrhizobium sp. ISRA463]WGS29976.1 carbohydrate ABC transporter permease [Bradyrhizobium sp. ISRA464]